MADRRGECRADPHQHGDEPDVHHEDGQAAGNVRAPPHELDQRVDDEGHHGGHDEDEDNAAGGARHGPQEEEAGRERDRLDPARDHDRLDSGRRHGGLERQRAIVGRRLGACGQDRRAVGLRRAVGGRRVRGGLGLGGRGRPGGSIGHRANAIVPRLGDRIPGPAAEGVFRPESYVGNARPIV